MADHAGPLYEIAEHDTYHGRLSAVYTASKNTDFYARVATGYRAPSIQGRLLFGDTPRWRRSRPITSGEIGVKSRLFDNRATISFDLFDYQMKNQQLTAVGGSGNTATLVNAKKTEGHGFELDAEAYLTDQPDGHRRHQLQLHTEIKDPNLYITPCGAAARCSTRTIVRNGTTLALIDGNPLPHAPKWIANVTARYSIPFRDGEFFVYTDWAYRSKVLIICCTNRRNSRANRGSIGGLRTGYTGMAANARSRYSAATSPTRRRSSAASTSTTSPVT